MSVNFELYHTFYYVGKFKNITAAAKALFVTQPTVTHAIQSLEKDLDCTLFIRSQKGVDFTPEGKKLFESISSACEIIFEAEASLEASKNLSEGYIAIGATETTLHHYLIPILTSFRKKYPNIHIKLFNSNTPDMLQKLLKNHLDFALLVLNPEYTNDAVSITHLHEFQDIFIGSSDFAKLKNRPVSLREINDYPLVTLGKGTVSRSFFEKLFSKYDLELHPDIELATTDLIVPIVENNLGIGIVPEPFARDSIKNSKIFQLKIKEQIPKREICLIKKKKTSLSLAGEAFIQYLLSDNQ